MRTFRRREWVGACVAAAVAILLHSCAPAPKAAAPAAPSDGRSAVQFVATVERVEYSPLVDSDLNWAVYVKVDRVISGRFPGRSFSFRVRNPTRDGIEIGGRVRATAAPFGAGYRVVRIEGAGRPPR